MENQATDRAYRIGQHRNVLVHKFTCRGTVEERIDALIDEDDAARRETQVQACERDIEELEGLIDASLMLARLVVARRV